MHGVQLTVQIVKYGATWQSGGLVGADCRMLRCGASQTECTPVRGILESRRVQNENQILRRMVRADGTEVPVTSHSHDVQIQPGRVRKSGSIDASIRVCQEFAVRNVKQFPSMDVHGKPKIIFLHICSRQLMLSIGGL